jgi:hypothetical protein
MRVSAKRPGETVAMALARRGWIPSDLTGDDAFIASARPGSVTWTQLRRQALFQLCLDTTVCPPTTEGNALNATSFPLFPYVPQ